MVPIWIIGRISENDYSIVDLDVNLKGFKNDK